MTIRKVLYLGFRHEFGKEQNGDAINYKAWYANFEDLGYEVRGVFYDGRQPEQVREALLAAAAGFRPDMLFIILQKDQIARETLLQLREAGHYLVGFFGDDQWRYDNFTCNYVDAFDACITTDKYSVAKYRRDGQQNVVYSQWAALDSDIEYQNVRHEYDVSFVGGWSRGRQWFVQELGRRGFDVKCFGDGWSAGRITYAEMERIFSVSKVNLNLSNSVTYDVRFLLSSPRGVVSAVRSVLRGGAKSSSQIKARNFEIPAQGGFQLTEYVPTLEDYFDIGRELVCYTSVDEAEKLIRYYLDNPEEREAIKARGVGKARECHTYKARIRAFMAELEGFRKRDAAGVAPGYPAARRA